MDTESLRILQAKFEPTRRSRRKAYDEAVSLREAFLKRFPEKALPNLSLESYSIGNKDKNSFCYWVELRTRILGDIRGATAIKFRVYFDKESGKYVFQKHYSSAKDALADTLGLITSLLAAVRKGDWNGVDDNGLSPMFKAKIASLYFPNAIAPIFADSHQDFFLRQLGLASGALSNIEKNRSLTQFKASDAVMAAWSPHEFMDFLYESFGRPTEKSAGGTSGALGDYLDAEDEFENPDKVQPETFGGIFEKPGGGRSFGHAENGSAFGQRISNEEAGRRGLQGELIVLKYEHNRLSRLGKSSLAGKIEHTALKKPGAGYDILSFNDDGSKRLIEVKSTVGAASGETVFMLTRNEYEVAKRTIEEGGSFYLYRVFHVKKKAPKVMCIKFSDLAKKARFEPLVFEVALSVRPV
jgi:hypothetical protein